MFNRHLVAMVTYAPESMIGRIFSPPEFKLIPIDEATWAPAQIALAWAPDRLSDRRSERVLRPAEIEALVDELERAVARPAGGA